MSQSHFLDYTNITLLEKNNSILYFYIIRVINIVSIKAKYKSHQKRFLSIFTFIPK